MKVVASTYEAYQLLLQGSLALADVERNGLYVDVAYLDGKIEEVTNKIKEYEKQLQEDKIFRKVWRRRYGNKSKLGSRKQLVGVVFEELGFKHPGTVTDLGTPSSGEKTFEDVDLPFVRDWMAWDRLKDKVLTTYLMGIKRELVGDYIHPNFLLNIANTYRSSCKEPNGQNFPTRNESMAKLIRTCFKSRFGDEGVIAEVDFSGLEVGIGACYHKDKNMLAFIKEGNPGRMHSNTAMQLFKIKEDQVDKKTTRDWSKNKCVFPMFYGSVYFQVAKDLWKSIVRSKAIIPNSDKTILQHLKEQGIAKLGDCNPQQPPRKGTFEYRVKEVEDYIWLKMFPGYHRWRKQEWENYLDTGYMTSLTGFCYQGLMKRNEVISYKIQGSAFHCDLQAIIWLNEWLKKNNMKSLIIGEIHDSCLLDVYLPEMEDIVAEVKEIFTVDLPKFWDWLIVPLTIEIEASPPGGSWYSKSPIHI